MSLFSRILFVAACLALPITVGCGGSPTAPSESGATIAGTVNPTGVGLFTTASVHAPLAASPGSSTWTVTIAGTSLTSTVDAAGNFYISGVGEGDVQLVFSDGNTSVTISVANVNSQELIQILVAINGGAATVLSETRISGKVSLCHRSDSTYHMIEVDASAEPAHRAHGDGEVGDTVPADPTKVFNSSCRPVPPGVDIEKFTNGEDADEAPGPSITVGNPVTWAYVVTNTGTLNLSDVSVVDDKGVTVNCAGRTTLTVGQSMTCTASGTAVAGQYRNVGIVSANSSGGVFRDSDASHYFGFAPTSSDDGPKVQLCHRTGNGRYHLIEVSVSAEPAHLAHGDGRPGQGGFSATCAIQ